MARTLGFNSTVGPVVVDQLGHSIGGGEWGAYDPAEPMAIALLATGELIDVPDLAAGGNYDPDAAQGWADVQSERVASPLLETAMATDTPATDTPATDTPATDTPAADTPAADTPAADTPAGDSAAASADSPAPARSRSTPKET